MRKGNKVEWWGEKVKGKKKKKMEQEIKREMK